MACIKGRSLCEICGKEFEWQRHDSQPNARFCSRKCTNKTFGITGNKNRTFWPKASDDEKKERLRKFYEEKVIRQEGCWDWKGSLDKDGYPQLYFGQTKAKGHRISYEIHKGEIPKGIHVCHSCDNPRCTNPEHLWLGTRKDNENDKIRKGRVSKGIERWNVRLSEDDVREIRQMFSNGFTKASIARKFKVTFMTITNLVRGKTWRHVI